MTGRTRTATETTHVLLDLDGTLSDSSPGIGRSLRHAFERCGYPPTTFQPDPRPGLLVDRSAVLGGLHQPGTLLVNALGRRQHRGERNDYGRRGHIPGSVNITAWEVLDRETGRITVWHSVQATPLTSCVLPFQ